MKILNKRFLLLPMAVTLIIVLGSCDKGIEPFPEPLDPQFTGFGGTITFVGEWPEGVQRTHLIVFRNPIFSQADFFPPNMSFIVDEVPFGVKEFNYNSNENNYQDLFEIEAGTYRYIAVAQSNTEEISLLRSDWVVVGIFYNEGNTTTPGSMTIQEGQITSSINIVCDFNNLPPQPPVRNNIDLLEVKH